MRVLTYAVVAAICLVGSAPLAHAHDGRATAQEGREQKDAKADAATKASSTMVNLNTATMEQLEALPGIGRSTAQRILEQRQKSGGFKKIEELMNVKGIGEKSFLKLKPLITVGAKGDKPTSGQ